MIEPATASGDRASTCAVVLTRNRRDLLAECLDAVLGQTRAPDRVLVVDNASTDGTAALLAERFPDVRVLRVAKNAGSAGGFGIGMRGAVDDPRGHRWLWLMDDDTVPRADALERLLAAADALADREPLLLASKVVWTDGRLHPMNWSGPRVRPMDDFVAAIERGVVEIRYTTWVSLLAGRDAVERFGLPRANYFTWSDDIEWTARVLRDAHGYLVPDSVATHRTPAASLPSEGGDRFYYAVRNGLFMLRSRSTLRWREKVVHAVVIAAQAREYLVANRFRPGALRVVARGLAHGLGQRAE